MNSFIENVNYVAGLDNRYGSGIELYKNNLSLKSVQHDIELKFSYYNNYDKKIHSIVHSEPGVLVSEINDALLSFKTLVESSITGSEFTCTVNFVINNISMVNISIVSNNDMYKAYELEMKVVTAGVVTYDVFGEVKDSLKILPSLAMITTSDIDAMANVYEIKEEIVTVSENIANVTTISNSIANVNTVVTNITNVNIVGEDIANVNTVASNIVGLNSIVSNVTEILLADDNAATATTKATEASTSATNAASSATASSNSAIASSTSATSASSSAATATTSSTSATASATSAATSASAATTKAAAADVSATSASTSASTATTKASEASASAAVALASKNQASTFAINASNSVTKASQWAENNYNVVVETGKYSAKHWATVAQNVVLDTVRLTGNETIAGIKTFSSNIVGSITGNSGTASKLQTAIAINGVSFDGSANITITDNTKLTKTNPIITGSITEQVYNLTGTEINPVNGTIQYKTVSVNTTFTETLTSGQSVLLRLIGASNYTITFPTITWVGAAAPVLTANCAIVLWKEQSTLYGAFVGTLV